MKLIRLMNTSKIYVWLQSVIELITLVTFYGGRCFLRRKMDIYQFTPKQEVSCIHKTSSSSILSSFYNKQKDLVEIKHPTFQLSKLN